MASRIKKVEKELLGSLSEGISYRTVEEVESLVEKGWVEQNPAMTDDDGKLATRLTSAGEDKLESLKKPEKVEPETVEVEAVVPQASLFNELAKTASEPEPDAPEPLAFETPDVPEKVARVEPEIEKNIPMPVLNKGRMRGSYKYPFEKMEIGDSFHVAKSEERPKPARTLASTVSTASKKYGKVFRVRSVGEEDPKGPGARVFRVE
jgi:hypothetical protein